MELRDGSRVVIMGGGPAGSFFAIFLLELAQRVGLRLAVDLFEPRDYLLAGPRGCNMCGGIISESLVQNLALEGILLPESVVQRALDSYVMHADAGSVRLETPLQEKRIASVYRGGGPLGVRGSGWKSFDGHLQALAVERGARVHRDAVRDARPLAGLLEVVPRRGPALQCDLLVVATGVNSGALKVLAQSGLQYAPPRTTHAAIREFHLGAEAVSRHLGTSMHVFLLDVPRVDCFAMIPKGDYVSFCILGERIDRDVLRTLLTAPEVTRVLPPGWDWESAACQCVPRITTHGSPRPFGDRLVFIGDCASTRLYKDGIGAAYRTAKAAASTAIFHGISARDFAEHYLPVCHSIERDNMVGRMIFAGVHLVRRLPFARRAILEMAAEEQAYPGNRRILSGILWDTFTGSAPYRDIALRMLRPTFLLHMLEHLAGIRRLGAALRRRGHDRTRQGVHDAHGGSPGQGLPGR